MGKKHHKKHKSEKKFADGVDDGGGESSLGAGTSGSQLPTGDSEKPLKLVLKVGSHETSETFSSHSQPTEERGKHKHKKKKKKKEGKEREREEVKKGSTSAGSLKRAVPEEEHIQTAAEEPVEKKPFIETETAEAPEEGETIEDRVRQSPRSCAPRPDDGAILRQCLEYLQKSLQNKDVNGFFAYPVTDSIAPGYSSIIHVPMDFSTMETKIERNEYRSVMEYKKDYMLMCNNAMIYNRPETVYYKEAKRLIHLGGKQLSKEKLLTLKKTQSWLANLTLAEIGIDENGKVLEDIPPIPEEVKPKEKPKSKSTKTVGTPFEPFPDTLSPEEIMAQAQAAAKEAHHQLTMRTPETDFMFLRRNKKGVTTLNILNPENEGIIGETERVVNLAELVGKVQSGTGSVPCFREDKRNKATPVHYLNYGPFSSFAPQYDSSFASVSKEESDLLLSTYGDETGVQYAKSVQSFVDSAGDYAVKMVNNLLDMLTKGQHTRTNHALEQQRKLEREKAAAAAAEESENADSSLAEKSPASQVDGTPAEVEVDPIQMQLDSTAEMIDDLRRSQDSRLSQTPPAHLVHCPGPNDAEVELAAKVSEGLADMTRKATPGDLVSADSLRKSMGIISPPAASTPPAGVSEETVGGREGGGGEMMEPLDNLPSAGTAESVAASQGTEEDEDDDDDEDEDEDDEDDDDDEEGDGDGEEVGVTGSGVREVEEEEEDEPQIAEEGVSEDPADLSEFFSSPSHPEDTSMSMDEGS